MNLLENAKSNLDYQKKKVLDAEKLYSIILDLPKDLRDSDGSPGLDYEGNVHLELWGGEPTKKIVENLGIKGLRRQLSEYTGVYYYTGGELQLDQVKITIDVNGQVAPPDNCRIEKYRKMTTKYREVCTNV